MRNSVLVAGAAFALMSTPAFAQVGESEPGNFRLEVLTGYDRVSGDIDDDFDDGTIDGGHSDGLFYGLAAGYDFITGAVNLGVDAEISESTTGESITLDNADIDGWIVDGTASLEASRDIYFGARIGSSITPSTAMYFKVGYSMARADFDADGSIDGEAGSIDANVDLEGLRLGGGVEHLIGKNLFVKAEYRYTNYTQAKISSGGDEFDVDAIFDLIDLERHQAVVGVGIRF